MTNAEMISSIVEKTGTSKKAAGDVVKALSEAVTEALLNGETVTLSGLGTFSVVDKEEKEYRNPSNGEKVLVAAHKAPKFKLSQTLKKVVAENN